MPEIRYEQAVYGSFPFWDRGYALLAHSPGCQPLWLAQFQMACEGYGEPPAGSSGSPALFSLRLPCGVWAVVAVGPQGTDDRGRPGALAFHGLFLDERQFRQVGFDPFQIAWAHRREWGPETTSLPTGLYRLDDSPDPLLRDSPPQGEKEQENGPASTARRIAGALARGRRVVVESTQPIDGLAREVWRSLPNRVRRRSSVTTLAFSPANRFDLLAMPRLAHVELGPSYMTSAALARASERSTTWRQRSRVAGLMAATLALVVLSVLGVVHGWGSRTNPGPGEPPTAPSPSLFEALPSPLPDRAAFAEAGPDERQHATDGLIDLLERFVPSEEPGPAARQDPTALMNALASTLRYDGPWLTDAEREQLERQPDSPDAVRALAWHAHLRHFARDRALPDDFASGSLRWRLALLAWTFRVEPHPGQTSSEVPFALAEALAAPWPVRPSPLATLYPALTSYARFLARLPRR